MNPWTRAVWSADEGNKNKINYVDTFLVPTGKLTANPGIAQITPQSSNITIYSEVGGITQAPFHVLFQMEYGEPGSILMLTVYLGID